MLQLNTGPRAKNCAGMTRRCALKAGFLGALGLSQADLLRLRAEGVAPRNDKAVILLWLDGGPSQLETYDPKPEAAVEFRGPYDTIATALPGVRLCEMLPGQARIAKDLIFVRSLRHGTGDHFAGAQWMLTGRFGSTTANMPQKFPSVGSIIAKTHGANRPDLPPYVGLPAAESVYLYPGYMGAAYLGAAYNPFDVDRAHAYLGATDGSKIGTPKWLTQDVSADRLGERRNLLAAVDRLRRDADASGTLGTMDKYQQQALDMILSGRAFSAFDLDKEDPKLAERYGPSPWARYTLMARRLVEAGVSFVTVDMPHRWLAP